MGLPPGTFRLGPDTATLSVRTGRAGAAAMAGHDLLIHVTEWAATIEAGDGSGGLRLELTAEPTSLRVREGAGGPNALGDAEREKIRRTIDDKVLKRKPIAFRSTSAVPERDGRIRVEGELSLFGAARPIAFDLTVDDRGGLAASATITQTNWGVKPYSAMLGALRVADEVEVALDGRLPAGG